jgi:hypothetical protein
MREHAVSKIKKLPFYRTLGYTYRLIVFPRSAPPLAEPEVDEAAEQKASENPDTQNVETEAGSAQPEAPLGSETPSSPAEEHLEDESNTSEIADAPSITPDDQPQNVAPIGTDEVTVPQ